MAAVDNNVKCGMRKRVANGKPCMGTRGLTLRSASGANAVDQPPPAKLQRLHKVPVVRPANGVRSKECELLTEDYVSDINEYLYVSEEQYLMSEGFLWDKKVTNDMRARLVNWIIQVYLKLCLRTETLHLAVYLLDRYLEKVDVQEEELQLLGASSLLAACKYEEVDCPEVEELSAMMDTKREREHMVRMEMNVVRAARFNLGRPHSHHFLRTYCVSAEATSPVHYLAKYLSEMCLMDSSFSSLKASLIAASSLWLADHVKGSELLLKEVFSSVGDVTFRTKVQQTGIRMAQWVMRVLEEDELRALTDKYSSSRMFYASCLTDEEEMRLVEIID